MVFFEYVDDSELEYFIVEETRSSGALNYKVMKRVCDKSSSKYAEVVITERECIEEARRVRDFAVGQTVVSSRMVE